MNRRNFLHSMIGGVAATAAVRTWPFRVYSFPSVITVPENLLARPADYYILHYPAMQDIQVASFDAMRELALTMRPSAITSVGMRNMTREEFSEPCIKILTGVSK